MLYKKLIVHKMKASSAKLFLEYTVIEIKSLVEVFDCLQTYVFKAPIFAPKEKYGWREITQEEHDKAKALLKIYAKAKLLVNSFMAKQRT